MFHSGGIGGWPKVQQKTADQHDENDRVEIEYKASAAPLRHERKQAKSDGQNVQDPRVVEP